MTLKERLLALADEIHGYHWDVADLKQAADFAERLRAIASEHGGGGEAEEASWRYRRQEIDKSMAVVYSLLTDHDNNLSILHPSTPVGVEERVRGIIALLRQPEPDNGEKYTEHDAGYDQASREIADMLERALTPPAAAPRVEAMRYQVKSESVLGHGCCFGATVVDAEGEGAIVCECFGLEEAQKIADALNAQEERLA